MKARAWRLVCFVFSLLPVTLLLTSTAAAQPQTQSPTPNYWQYAASGRLRHVIPADVNQDGVDEFLIAAENGKVDLISADGRLQWSYAAGEPVLALSTVNLEGATQREREIVIGLRNRLVVLTAAGDEIWSAPIEPLVTPAVLLTDGGEAARQSWLDQYNAIPVSIAPFDSNDDGREEILVLLQSGQLQLFDVAGSRVWHYPRNNNPLLNMSPQMVVADLDGDGQSEIALGYFNPNPSRRFSQFVIIDNSGRPKWTPLSVSGRITAMTLTQFGSQATPYVAVGTSLGQVNLYNVERQRLWLRTLNKPVTDLALLSLPDGPALAVGTSVGSVVVFNEDGRRLWDNKLAPEAERGIVTLAAVPFAPEDNQPVLSAVLGRLDNGRSPVDIVLMDGNGRPVKTITDVDNLGLSRLIDMNNDQKGELLLARFATLELLGLGIGASQTAPGWEYSLFTSPNAYLVTDLDQDGTDELIVGTQDGRLHALANGNDVSILWLHIPGGVITHLATLIEMPNTAPNLVVARTQQSGVQQSGAQEGGAVAGTLQAEGWLELRQANGEKIWEQQLPGEAPAVTSLLVANVHNGNSLPEIIAGTSDGRVIVYSATGTLLWETALPEEGGDSPLEHLLLLEATSAREAQLIAASREAIYAISPSSLTARRIASYDQAITGLYQLNQPGNELATVLLVLLSSGEVQALNWRGILLPPWPFAMSGVPNVSLPVTEMIEEAFQHNTGDAYLIANTSPELLRLTVENNQPHLEWRLPQVDEITSLYWGDLDGDALSDIATSNRDGKVRVYGPKPDGPELIAELDVSSPVFALTALRRGATRESNLLLITENGQVQLFRAQENRPPLLTNPIVDVAQGQYSISVAVRDVENNDVTVGLEVQNPESRLWEFQGERRLNGGNGQISLNVVEPKAAADGVHYRLYYSDGFHKEVYLTLPPGPPPVPPLSFNVESAMAMGASGILILIIVVVVIRQSQTASARARRFYRRLRQQPEAVFTLLENKYAHTEGSPDFLLSLASHARQAGDWFIASLADGLFLLANRPHAGLSIMNSALEDPGQPQRGRQASQRWRITYKTGQALLDAPSITELSLLRPQLVQLLSILEEGEQWSPALESLLPILTNLRDSERVELVEDRLVYLNEAAFLINQLQEQLPEFSTQIHKTLVGHILRRWSGLVSAEIEELRGRAELVVSLKTKRLVPNGRTDVALEIRNSGRAAAENIIAYLDENPAYQVHSEPQSIPLLPPGRKRQVSFAVEPRVQDRFRIALNLTYDDRNQRDKRIAFGDMVHLLPPVRDFRPIANPYIPGTPLRRDSTLFYGREELFNFIAENVGHINRRNVLILVGQRRTGKTSALLQLEHHLPRHLLPVYIDCQSLGVTPGLPALLYDLAWHIADVLSSRGLAIDVADPVEWQDDAAGYFQRHFLAQVRTLLGPEQTVVLVFDEFEAFENLVHDGILPATFFTYMRHLMQHSDGLSFIFVGTSRLEEMSADYWSVLFNIALYQKIGYLSDSAATRLICEPVAPNLVYDDLALDKILRVTSGHPYFLQLVCYTLVKQANAQRTGYVTISDVNAALDEMLRLGEVHFAYLWQRSSHTERALLTAVAHLMDRDTPFHPEDLIEYLEPYDIHLDPAEVTAALNRLVEREIMREVTEEATTLYELKIGLVGLWAAQNKSLSKLYASNGEAATFVRHRKKVRAGE